MAQIQTPPSSSGSAGQLSGADAFMLRLLGLPTDAGGTVEEAQSAFQTSIVISSIRCLLTYIVLPFVAPTFTFFAQAARPIGIVVSLVAMLSITMSARRFWRARHPQRWAYTILGGLMFCFVTFMLIRDIIG